MPLFGQNIMGDCWQARYGVGPCQDWKPCENWRRFRQAAVEAGYGSGYLAASELKLWNCTYEAAIAFVLKNPVSPKR